MNVFNRVLIVLLALALLVAAGAVLLTTLHVTQPGQLAPNSWFADRLQPFALLDPALSGWTVGISIGLILAALVLLFLELRPEPRPPQRITLREDASGRVTVSLDGIRELVDREARQVAGIERVRSQVSEEPTGLRIQCRVFVDPATSVPDMTQDLQERLKAAVQHHVGLSVTQVSIDAQVAPPVTDRRPRRRVQ
jgi:uncharacterized alkaline shock family protein YloU